MNDGGPAFPESAPNQQGRYETFQKGMSLRDWFAGKALEAILIAQPHLPKEAIAKTPQDIPTAAYYYADAMLKAREAK
jgi:hypothetical protein